MPTVCIPLDETNKTILNNSYYEITKQILDHLNIRKDHQLVIKKGLDDIRTDVSTNVSNLNTNDNTPTTVSNRLVLANIEENYDEEYLTATPVSQKDAFPIFIDNQVDVRVYPIYVQTEATITLKIYVPSKTEARQLRDDIRIKLSQSRNILHNEVEYDLIIPDIIDDFISDVYDLKNRLFPSTLEDYFRNHSTKRIHMITDLANPSNSRIAVREKQVRIVGIFDFGLMPDKEEEDVENNRYILTIPYKFSFSTPRGLCFTYPPVICNKVLPSKYLQFIEDGKVKGKEEYSKQSLSYTYSLGALSHFEAHRQLQYRVQEKLPLNLPLFDEWPVRTGHNGYVILCSILTTVDETDRKTLFNLRDLKEYGYYIDEKLLDYIANGERQWIVNPYMSHYYMGVHQKDKYFDNNMLEILPDLTVKSKVELPIVKPTRVTISICLDTTYFNPTVKARMFDDKEMLLLYLNELIRCINNFKPEVKQMNITENTFYRFFLQILNHYTVKEDQNTLQTIVNIIAKDNKIMEVLNGILSNNYQRLYAKLCKYTDIDNYYKNKNYKRNYTGEEEYNARTVMNAYTASYRMSDLEKQT